jgi:hypothetical protein
MMKNSVVNKKVVVVCEGNGKKVMGERGKEES